MRHIIEFLPITTSAPATDATLGRNNDVYQWIQSRKCTFSHTDCVPIRDENYSIEWVATHRIDCFQCVDGTLVVEMEELY